MTDPAMMRLDLWMLGFSCIILPLMLIFAVRVSPKVYATCVSSARFWKDNHALHERSITIRNISAWSLTTLLIVLLLITTIHLYVQNRRLSRQITGKPNVVEERSAMSDVQDTNYANASDTIIGDNEYATNEQSTLPTSCIRDIRTTKTCCKDRTKLMKENARYRHLLRNRQRLSQVPSDAIQIINSTIDEREKWLPAVQSMMPWLTTRVEDLTRDLKDILRPYVHQNGTVVDAVRMLLSQVSAYKVQIAACEAIIDSSTTYVDTQAMKIAKLEDQIQGHERQRRSSAAQTQAGKDSLCKLENQVDKGGKPLAEAVAQMNTRIALLTKEKVDLKKEKDDFAKKFYTLQKEHAEGTDKRSALVHSLEDQIFKVQEELRGSQAREKVAMTINEENNEELEKIMDELEAVQRTASFQKEQLVRYEAEVSVLREHRQSHSSSPRKTVRFQNEMIEPHKSPGQAKQRNDPDSAKFMTHVDQPHDAGKQTSDMNNNISQEQIDAHSQDLDTPTQENTDEQLKETIQEQAGKIIKLDLKIEAMINEGQNLQNEVETARTQGRVLQSQVEAMEKEGRNLQAEVTRLKLGKSDLQKHLEEARAVAQMSSQEASEQLSTLQNQVISLQIQLSEAKQLISTSTSTSSDSTRDRVRELEKQLRDTKDTFTRRLQDNERMIQQQADLKDDFERQKNELEEQLEGISTQTSKGLGRLRSLENSIEQSTLISKDGPEYKAMEKDINATKNELESIRCVVNRYDSNPNDTLPNRVANLAKHQDILLKLLNDNNIEGLTIKPPKPNNFTKPHQTQQRPEPTPSTPTLDTTPLGRVKNLIHTYLTLTHILNQHTVPPLVLTPATPFVPATLDSSPLGRFKTLINVLIESRTISNLLFQHHITHEPILESVKRAVEVVSFTERELGSLFQAEMGLGEGKIGYTGKLVGEVVAFVKETRAKTES